MNAAELLRAELANKNQEIINTRFEPNKEKAMEILARGIKRIGYVCVDTLCHAGTCEGDQLSAALDLDCRCLNAAADWLKKEGFTVTRQWWGFSTDGDPDMIKIRL